jgi:putative hydrolase of the HAD superfamily
VAVDVVIFDWGGTLSQWAEIDLADMWLVAARHLGGGEELVERLIDVEKRFWRRVEETQKSAQLAEVLHAATRELDLDVTEAVLEEAATHHLDAWTPHIRHDPDAAPVLGELRARGLGIGLLSNTLWPRAFHERFLERDGLGELIDARLYTSDLPHTKPHPSAFEAALDALGVGDARRAVFVGDRPFDDIMGAQRVGMRAVLRPNPAVPPYDAMPDATIERLPELLDLVEGWRHDGA